MIFKVRKLKQINNSKQALINSLILFTCKYFHWFCGIMYSPSGHVNKVVICHTKRTKTILKRLQKILKNEKLRFRKKFKVV